MWEKLLLEAQDWEDIADRYRKEERHVQELSGTERTYLLVQEGAKVTKCPALHCRVAMMNNHKHTENTEMR